MTVIPVTLRRYDAREFLSCGSKMQFNRLKRRDFITLLGAAAWPLAARAQRTAIPVIGYLNGGSPRGSFASFLSAFRHGLSESGYVEGQNVFIEYRWAEGHYDRLPALATDLVDRKVDLIAAGGGDLAAHAAKSATSIIPIVCTSGDDPVATGLVASLGRPGGNVTGVSFLVVELHAKRFELISEMVPQARVIGLIVNPASPQTERVIASMEKASRSKGIQLLVLRAGDDREIRTAFDSLVQRTVGALVVQADPLFIAQRQQFAELSLRHSVPAIYEGRSFVEVGGLISYGASFPAVYHQVGVYAGKILKGEKPADLPVLQPTKFELVINARTAKALGLTVPPTLLVTADQIIE
jgi:putative tryptophan/tyrosine transport system substrate-binding protein